MSFIHIPELARLMLEYLELPEAFTLGFLYGGMFPKIAAYADSIMKAQKDDRDKVRLTDECLRLSARLGWTGTATELVDRYVKFPRLDMIDSICCALQHGHAPVFKELHAVYVRLHKRDGLRVINGSIEYSFYEKNMMAEAAAIGGTIHALMDILGGYWGINLSMVSVMLLKAAEVGHVVSFDFIYLLDDRRLEGDTLYMACCRAATGGHLEMVKRIVRYMSKSSDLNRCAHRLTSDDLADFQRRADANGHFDVGRWLKATGAARAKEDG